jgi:Protein of unknown function (DUF3667)
LTACTNCGVEAADVYCARCGEKQPHHHDLTVGHFTHDVVHELVHLDSKLFTTLKLLVVKPGFLTAEHFAGHKKRYIGPIRLFLTLFAIQFLAYTAYKPAAMWDVQKFARFDKSGGLQQMIDRKAAKFGTTAEGWAERVNTRWQKILSVSQFVTVLGLAVVLKVIYIGRKRYLVEHLVFAAHYLAFTYLMAILLWPLYAVIGFELGPTQQLITVFGIAVHLTYLFLAQRRFYGVSRGSAALKTALAWGGAYVVQVVLITASLFAALWQYR